MGQRTRTTWTTGQGGKPKGAKDKWPRSARSAVTRLLEKFGNDLPLLTRTLRRGLEARPPSSFPYLKLLIEQQVVAPDAPALPVVIIHDLRDAPGPPRSAWTDARGASRGHD